MMDATTRDNIERVTRYSRSLRLLFQLLFGLVVVAGLGTIVLIFASYPTLDVAVGAFRFRGENIGIAARLSLVPGVVFAVAIALKLLYHLIALFGLYSRRQIFTVSNVRQMRQIGVALMLTVPLWLYLLLVGRILLSAGGSAAGAAPAISFEPAPPFTALITGIMIIVVSWIMDVGRELSEEQDLTV